MTRQAALRREPDPLRLWAVLDEAVLRRVVGSRAIMRHQVRHLAEMALHPKITVQVVPNEHGAHPGMTGRFQILGFPWPTDPGVAYIEHRAGALYLEEPYEIDAHIVAFEHLCVLAVPGRVSDNDPQRCTGVHMINPHRPDAAMDELETAPWRKSSFSGDQGSCVETAPLNDDRIAVRNSNHPEAGVVFFTRAEMDAWIKGCKAGEFDDLCPASTQTGTPGSAPPTR